MCSTPAKRIAVSRDHGALVLALLAARVYGGSLVRPCRSRRRVRGYSRWPFHPWSGWRCGVQPGEVIKFRTIRWEGLSRAPVVLARGFSKYMVGLAIKQLLQVGEKKRTRR